MGIPKPDQVFHTIDTHLNAKEIASMSSTKQTSCVLNDLTEMFDANLTSNRFAPLVQISDIAKFSNLFMTEVLFVMYTTQK